MVTQEQVNLYVEGALRYPIIDEEHLVSMVILHFDIPDRRAKEMVEISLEPPHWRLGED